MAAMPIVFSELYLVAKFFLNLLLLKLTTVLRSRSSTTTTTSASPSSASTDDDDRRRRLIDEKYPHYHYHAPPPPGEDCAVCLCELEKGDAVRELGCRHTFHKDCVDTWLALEARKKRAKGSPPTAATMTCPLCRTGVLQTRRVGTSFLGGGGYGYDDDSLEWGQQQLALLLCSLRGDHRQIIN
ncbi:unnamed protein product [Linum tenue]|uniref:RING-type domain-containing protein n=1 Tax=Linum tenue TaxID=586396 RepID=A0AAV0RAQ2_9ROSI|nr:unnamed protein product [Linum tenue]